MTSYSSRGPTRSFYTDTNGIRHHDNILKPDLVAPGNKIIAAEAAMNNLAKENPVLDANISPDEERKMMTMNGTSVAALVVTGAVALILQANPTLTPNLVKAILMYTAQPLAGYNLLEQGAGELNIEGAVRLAKLVRTDLTANTPLGDPLLKSSDNLLRTTTINGFSFPWAQGILVDHTFATGDGLITKFQRTYTRRDLLTNGIIFSDRTLWSSGIIFSDSLKISDGNMLGNGTFFCGTGIIFSDGTITPDGIIFSDIFLQAQGHMKNGDATNTMPVILDDGKDNTGY